MNNKIFSLKNRVFSVSEITENIKSLLDKNIGYVFIRGEVSNLRISDAGHSYFTLKDEKSQISAVLFRGNNTRIDFRDGSRIIVGGLVTVYPLRGVYQIIVNQVIADGLGDLYKRFEDLKKRLYEKGLFSEEIKKDIPLHCFEIGLITTPYGAAVIDFLRTAYNKSSFVNIYIYAVRVQGEGAADDIITGIRYFNQMDNVDVIAIVRGGGSFEDLYCFNDECLAYAIRESKIPVVTGIGHEVDYTIADYAADLRAATPTAAAELIVPSDEEIFQTISRHKDRIDDEIKDYILDKRRVVNRFISTFYRDKDRLDEKLSYIEGISTSLHSSIHRVINNNLTAVQNLRFILERNSPLLLLDKRKEQLSFLNLRMNGGILNRIYDLSNAVKDSLLKLELLNPENILKKGYSVVYRDGRVIKGAYELSENDLVKIRFYDGDVKAIIRNHPK